MNPDHLKSLMRRGMLTLSVERLMQVFAWVILAIFVFACATLLNVWAFVPTALHWIILVGFVVGIGFGIYWTFRQFRKPTDNDIIRRAQDDAQLPHQPLSSLQDTPFDKRDPNDPLWQGHLKYLAKLAAQAKILRPRFNGILHRFHILSVIGLIFFVLAGFQFGNWGHLMTMALTPGAGSSQFAQVNIWAEPPAYTRKSPVILMNNRTIADQDATSSLPQHSTLHISLSDVPRFGLGAPRIRFVPDDGKSSRIKLNKADGAFVSSYDVDHSGEFRVSFSGQKYAWRMDITPDLPPAVTYTNDITITDDLRVEVKASIADDYGIENAWVLLAPDPTHPRPLDEPAFAQEILDTPIALIVNQLTGRTREASAQLSLGDHPYAGLHVLMTIKVEDAAGQTALSETKTVKLPKRDFFNPLSKAINHERQNLALAPNSIPRTAKILDALTMAPYAFYDDPREYLMLRTAFWHVDGYRVVKDNQVHFASDAQLLDDLWSLTTRLEDTALDLAKRRLEAAQRALREALERGDPQDEIDRLTEEMRQAMKNYIRALQMSGQQQAQSGGGEGGGGKSMTKDELEEMLAEIQRLNEAGETEKARALLSELEDILANMQLAEQQGQGDGEGEGSQGGQAGSGGGSGGGGAGENGEQSAMNEAADMIAKQRELADDTYEEAFGEQGDGDDGQNGEQDENGNAGNGESGEDGSGGQDDNSNKSLAARQQALADDLQQQILGLGGDDSEDAQAAREAFREAMDEMRAAAESLESMDSSAQQSRRAMYASEAGRAQQEAMSALREGAQSLAALEASKEENGNGEGEGEGDGNNPNGQQADSGNNGSGDIIDPTGRSYSRAEQGYEIDIPDFSNPEEVRKVMDEIRRRLADPTRSQDEIDYLERLLDQF